MDPKSGVGSTVGMRVRQWLSRWGFKQWRRVVVVVALACTAAFGGLDTVDTSITTVKPRDEFSNGEFTTTIERATLVRQVQAGDKVLYPEKQGRSYLGVLTRVRNDSTLPGRLGPTIELRDVPSSRFLAAMRFEDGSTVVDQGPGLTDQIGFMWELPQTALAVGDTVTLRIWKQVQRLNATYGEGLVPSRTDYVQVVVPVGGQT
jgi:hypothetical protein